MTCCHWLSVITYITTVRFQKGHKIMIILHQNLQIQLKTTCTFLKPRLMLQDRCYGQWFIKIAYHSQKQSEGLITTNRWTCYV